MSLCTFSNPKEACVADVGEFMSDDRFLPVFSYLTHLTPAWSSCDFRRAVIILDSVLLAIAVISMIGLIAGTAVDNLNLDDDDILEIVEDSCKCGSSLHDALMYDIIYIICTVHNPAD